MEMTLNGLASFGTETIRNWTEVKTIRDLKDAVTRNIAILNQGKKIIQTNAPKQPTIESCCYPGTVLDRRVLQKMHVHLQRYVVPIATGMDGNCLFYAISITLTGHQHLGPFLRVAAIHQMILEEEFYSRFLPRIGETFEKFILGLKRDGTYGETIVVHALSTYLQRHIYIYAQTWRKGVADLDTPVDLLRQLQEQQIMRCGLEHYDHKFSLCIFYETTPAHYTGLLRKNKISIAFKPVNVFNPHEILGRSEEIQRQRRPANAPSQHGTLEHHSANTKETCEIQVMLNQADVKNFESKKETASLKLTSNVEQDKFPDENNRPKEKHRAKQKVLEAYDTTMTRKYLKKGSKVGDDFLSEKKTLTQHSTIDINKEAELGIESVHDIPFKDVKKCEQMLNKENEKLIGCTEKRKGGRPKKIKRSHNTNNDQHKVDNSFQKNVIFHEPNEVIMQQENVNEPFTPSNRDDSQNINNGINMKEFYVLLDAECGGILAGNTPCEAAVMQHTQESIRRSTRLKAPRIFEGYKMTRLNDRIQVLFQPKYKNKDKGKKLRKYHLNNGKEIARKKYTEGGGRERARKKYEDGGWKVSKKKYSVGGGREVAKKKYEGGGKEIAKEKYNVGGGRDAAKEKYKEGGGKEIAKEKYDVGGGREAAKEKYKEGGRKEIAKEKYDVGGGKEAAKKKYEEGGGKEAAKVKYAASGSKYAKVKYYERGGKERMQVKYRKHAEIYKKKQKKARRKYSVAERLKFLLGRKSEISMLKKYATARGKKNMRKGRFRPEELKINEEFMTKCHELKKHKRAIVAALLKAYVRIQMKRRSRIPYNITATWKIMIHSSGWRFFTKVYHMAYQKFVANSLCYLKLIRKLERFVNNRKKVINDIQKEIEKGTNSESKPEVHIALPNEEIQTLVGYVPQDFNMYNQYVGFSDHVITQEAYGAHYYKSAKELGTIVIQKANLLEAEHSKLDRNRKCDNRCTLPSGFEMEVKASVDEIVNLRYSDMTNPASCSNTIEVLKKWYPHFPTIRTMLRRTYEIRESATKTFNVLGALENADVQTLLSGCEMRGYASRSHSDASFRCKEDTLEQILKSEFSKFIKTIEEAPINICFSCQMMFYRSQVVKPRRDLSKSMIVKELETYYERNEKQIISSEDRFYCHHCIGLIGRGKVPSKSVINNLHVTEVPEEIKSLNFLERQLLQTMKCFQTVVSLKPYKGIGISSTLQKGTRGVAFHLPLPTKETLEALPSSNQNIIIGTTASNNHVIHRVQVNMAKVYKALEWLKENNPHYKNIQVNERVNKDKIVLPNIPDEFVRKEALDVVGNPEQRENENHNLQGNSDSHEIGTKGIDMKDVPHQLETASLKKSYVNKLVDEFDLEHYTLIPKQLVVPNVPIEKLYQMDKVEGDVVKRQEPDTEQKCFFWLFPRGESGLYSEREHKLRNCNYYKVRLFNKDGRFRGDHQYVSKLLADKMSDTMFGNIITLLKMKKDRTLTAASLIRTIEERSPEIDVDISAFLNGVRGTPQYWSTIRRNLTAIVNELGSPTFFLTLSNSDYDWPDLRTVLISVLKLPKNTTLSNSDMIARDPINTARHVQRRFETFMSQFITGGLQVLGKVSAWAGKVEFQQRGSTHFHLILWIQNAPLLTEGNEECVVKFIDSLITAELPNLNDEPLLANLINDKQRHVCNEYCGRRKMTGNKTGSCRFKFPRPVKEQTEVYLGTHLQGRRYAIKRKQESCYINDYNPELIRVWLANMDISYIGESNISAVLSYLTPYVTKAEKNKIDISADEFSKNNNIVSTLMKLGSSVISNRVISMQEAFYLLSGTPLFYTSEVIKYQNISEPHKRARKPKSYKIVKELAERNPDSRDIYFFSKIEYYESRPEELETISFKEFLEKYDIEHQKETRLKLTGNMGYLRERTKKAILAHNFTLRKIKMSEDEGFFYGMLLLNVPFRSEEELLHGHMNARDAFMALDENIKQKIMEYQKFANYYESRMKTRDTCNETNDTAPELMVCDPTVACRILDKRQEETCMFQKDTKPAEPIDLEEMINNLNDDQLKVFQYITSALQAQAVARVFVTGVGGTGKSFLISALKEKVYHEYEKDACLLLAPTGISAFNIDGTTIHRALRLAIDHKVESNDQYELDPCTLSQLRQEYKNVKLIIIDEISMVSNRTLEFINERLNMIFDSPHSYFGDKTIALFGDLLQLKPPKGKFAFEGQKSSIGIHVNLWSLFTYMELNKNVRQAGDPQYAAMLESIRLGKLRQNDYDLLRSRRIFEHVPTTMKDIIEKLTEYFMKNFNNCDKPICLFPTNKMVKSFNEEMLKNLHENIIEIKSIDSCYKNDKVQVDLRSVQKKLKKMNEDVSLTAGLDNSIRLAIGCRIMLKRNISIDKGLVNGSLGTVTDLIFDIEGKYVEKIEVRFDHLKSAEVIERMAVRFQVYRNTYILRQQLPIQLAYAITIHKSQGLSLNKVMCYLGPQVFDAGMAYVALSRVTALEGLYLIAFDPKAVYCNLKAVSEYNRLKMKLGVQPYREPNSKESIKVDESFIGVRNRTQKKVEAITVEEMECNSDAEKQ